MFTRLLVGLDGSPRADQALEQAVQLGRRFGSTIIVAHVRERGAGSGERDGGMLERARERVVAAGLKVETMLREGEGAADLVLAELAKGCDAVLVGRRGVTTRDDALGPTVAVLVRIAEPCVIVCGGAPSPMTSCAIAFDGRETSKRALDLVARFAGIVQSTVHIIHASADRDAGLKVVGEAEAALSLAGVEFMTHIEAGTPGEVVARVIARTHCDALFVGAHVPHTGPGRPSPVVVSHAEDILRHTDIPVVIQP